MSESPPIRARLLAHLSVALDALYRVSWWTRAGVWGCRLGGVALRLAAEPR